MISVPLMLASGRRCGALGAGPHVRAGMAGRGPMLVPLNCATGGRCGALGAGPHMRAGMAGRGAAMGAWVCGGRIPIMAIDALEMAIASSNVTGIAFSSFFFVGVQEHNSQRMRGGAEARLPAVHGERSTIASRGSCVVQKILFSFD